MLRTCLLLMVLLALSWPTAISPAVAAGAKLGVTAFDTTDPAKGRQIAEVFLTDLARTGKLQLVEREQLEKVVKELALAQTGLVDPATASRIGKMVGATKLVVGSMAVQGNQVVLNARLLDVTSGQVDTGENIQGSEDQLFLLIHQLANRFHRRLTGEWIPSMMTASGPEAAKLGFLQDMDPTKWATNPQSPLSVVVEVNKGQGSTYKDEEPLTVTFRVEVKEPVAWGQAQTCYLTLYNIDASGKIYLVYPNHWAQDNKVVIGKTYRIPDESYELGFVGDPGEERFLAIATRLPLELVEGMAQKLKEETIPTVSESAKEFGTRGVVPKMKKLKATDWGIGQTFFYREKK